MKNGTRHGLSRLLALLAALVLVMPALPAARAEEDTGAKLLAITFDDGPSIHTPILLDGLEERGVVATFFMCGTNGGNGVVQHHDLLTRMNEMGCQMSNHSNSHPNFAKLSAKSMQTELEKVETYLYKEAGGPYLDLVRIPGGANNAAIRANVKHPMITWSVDPMDWRDRNADTVYQRIVSSAKDGAVILLHDLYLTSIEGGLRAIDTLKAQGYEFVTVSELFRRRGVYLENGVVYNSAPNKGVNRPGYVAPTLNTTVDPVTGETLLTMYSPDLGIDTIHYTTDGSRPTLASPTYTGPVPITANMTVTAAGFDRFATRTPLATRTVYDNGTAAPRIEGYSGGRVTLSSATPGSRILYTTDGSDPRTNGVDYTGPFVPGTETRAVAEAGGKLRSTVTSFTKTSDGSLFYDVSPNAWYFDAVGDVAGRGLMGGTGEYTFNPEGGTTRGALVSILYRMEGSPASAGKSAFKDVPDWCAAAVDWAASGGFVSGTGKTTFNPTGLVSRQQAAAILYRYAMASGRTGLTAITALSSYPDGAAVADYAQEAMAWCVSNGLLRPNTEGKLQPEAPALRGQCAAMFSALLALR